MVAIARLAEAHCLSDDAGAGADADAFFHESMERLAGILGATFEGVSIDWIAGTDPVAGPPAGPQILTADGWKPINPTDREAKAK